MSLAIKDAHEIAPELPPGLIYVSDEKPGISRKRNGTGFSYYLPSGERITDRTVLERIRSLAVPPAYSQVWICTRANGHIQATGRDERGRKQYRYHPEWRLNRDMTKFDNMLAFGAMLPKIRERVEEDLGKRGLSREKVLATVVRLLETTLIRIGNRDYAKQNGSYGLTTLRTKHVKIEGDNIKFEFKGKSGKTWRLSAQDRRISRVVKACQELPGQDLFQYQDEEGQRQSVTSSDVNDYLREISGHPFTAKDFRTWAGSVLAAASLAEQAIPESMKERKRGLRETIVSVASRLGNTPTICQKCYVHPKIIEAFLEASPDEKKRPSRMKADAYLSYEEKALLRFLKDLPRSA